MTEAQQAIVKKALHELGEQFDTVQLFLTSHQPAETGGTVHAAIGIGNWYARIGQVRDWVIAQDEETKCLVRGRVSAQEDDGEG